MGITDLHTHTHVKALLMKARQHTSLRCRFEQTLLLELLSAHGRLLRFLLHFFPEVGGDSEAGNGKDEAGEEDDTLVVGDPIDVKAE